MGKAKIVFIILVSILIFTFVQILIYGRLDSWGDVDPFNFVQRSRERKSKHALNRNIQLAVASYLDVCKELKINVVLIDRDILKHLTDRVKRYSEGGTNTADEHRGCHYFCNQNTFTFGVFEPLFQESKQWQTFSGLLAKKNFKSELLQSPDDRHLSLEDSNSHNSIITHAISYNNRAIIHMVLFYERSQRYWSSNCIFNNTHKMLKFHLENKKFCKDQNILKRFTTMTTSMDRLKVDVPFYPVQFLANLEQSTFIPCDMKRARKFYSIYGFDKSVDAEIFRIKAKTVLSYVTYHLDQLGIPFWLSSGTCLGWFRQCDFITHSKDVDIGIFIKDYNPDISKRLKTSGLLPKHIFGKVKDSFELSFRTASNDLKLDIFFFYEEPTYTWNGGTQARTGNKYKYRFPKFSLCWTEFVGLFVRVPCKTIDYVKANYGAGWSISVKEWDWKKSPSNVEENGKWPAAELSRVVQVFQ